MARVVYGRFSCASARCGFTTVLLLAIWRCEIRHCQNSNEFQVRFLQYLRLLDRFLIFVSFSDLGLFQNLTDRSRQKRPLLYLNFLLCLLQHIQHTQFINEVAMEEVSIFLKLEVRRWRSSTVHSTKMEKWPLFYLVIASKTSN